VICSAQEGGTFRVLREYERCRMRSKVPRSETGVGYVASRHLIFTCGRTIGILRTSLIGQRKTLIATANNYVSDVNFHTRGTQDFRSVLLDDFSLFTFTSMSPP